VQKNHLIEKGVEFILIVTPDNILVGETNFVQDFEDWSKRDYGRPARDSKSGMLPPKLARLMVNLTGKDPYTSSLLDPFCGSGTVLMEASLLGYPKIVGSDISQKAIEATEKNTRWLEHHYKTESETTTLVHDATETFPEEIGPFDAIVGEGYLGPPTKKLRGTEELNIPELEELYKKALPKVLHELEPDGVAILAFPFFKTRDKEIFLNLHIPNGYKIEPIGESQNKGLTYARKNQLVGREIVKMRKI